MKECPICGGDMMITTEETMLGKILVRKCSKCRWEDACEYITPQTFLRIRGMRNETET